MVHRGMKSFLGRVIVFSLSVGSAIPLLAASTTQSLNPWITTSMKVLYDDDFDKFHNWIEGPTGPCHTAYGNDGFNVVLVTRNVDTCVFHMFGAGYFSGNIRIDAYAKLAPGGSMNAAYGIEFGHKDRNVEDGYFYLINAQGKYGVVWAGKSRKAIIPWTADNSIRHGIGQENHLAIEISGHFIRLYINGKYLRSVTMGSDISGYIGLEVDPNIKVAFRRIRVAEFYQSTGGDVPQAFSVGQEIAWDSDLPLGEHGGCVLNRSQHYLTLTRLPAATGPCIATVSTAMDSAIHIAPTSGVNQIRIEATARILQGSDSGGYGLAFSINAGGETNYYFEISGNGSLAVLAVRKEHQQKLMGWKQEELIKRGYNADNYLAVEVFGQSFYCYVNGKYVGSVEIPTTDILEFGYAVDFRSLSAGFKDIEFNRILGKR